MHSFLYRVSHFIILLVLATEAFAQTREITSVAGTGTPGYSGDGGPATAAQLKVPSDVSVDPEGNFYIADRDNNRIRRVDASSGVITTVAGNGTAGWFFSGGQALFASLDRPSGVAVDPAGNFYIADLLENDFSRIHKVTAATGLISRIELPVIIRGAVSIALDAGNLYIGEQAGHVIRKVDLGSGAFSTIAGTGAPGFSGDGGPATSAQINSPAHISVDRAGNIYFSDSVNNRIRRVTPGGTISTVAGSGPGGFGGDGGPATSAQLNDPRGVAVDAAGNIYIADTLNKRLRRVSARTGVITTIVDAGLAGEGCAAASASLQFPDSLSVNSAGTLLYVVDVAGNRVGRVTLDPNSPAPTLTSIAPPNGLPGTTLTVNLTGTAFLGGAIITSGEACRVFATTVFVSGTGVTVSNVSAANNTSLQATLIISPDAALGPRNVTVTTDSGTTGPVVFSVAAQPPPPVPTLSSISPPNGGRGSTSTFTLTGTNFDAQAAMNVSVDGGGISISDVRVVNAGTLTATFTIAPEAALGNHNVAVSSSRGASNALPFAVQPQGPAFTYGLPPMLNPTEQTPVQVALVNPVPDEVTGTLTLTFVPNAATNRDDPNVMFINAVTATRNIDVTFPANTATAEFSLPSGVLQAGTVAGTIELSMADVAVGGVDVSPASSDFDVQVPRLAPVITNVRLLNRSSEGFDVEVTGYSTTREITLATFSFAAAGGKDLSTVQLQPEVSTTFSTYYQSDTSAPVGSAFVYLQPFIITQGTGDAVASITLTLTNTVGTSEARTVQ